MTQTEESQQKTACLADVIAAGTLAPIRAKLLARQVAEELCLAHRLGLSHGEVSVSNVILVGSGDAERAVLNGLGGHTNIYSEIHAFGQVLETLMPGHRLASECMAPNPYERPDSFELILEELQDISTQRTWIGSLLIAAATASLFLYELSVRSHA
jgi:hypothetical protein